MSQIKVHLALLDALPEDNRQRLVVRSMPFGDIIDNQTREVFIEACEEHAERHSGQTAYLLCQAAKGNERARSDLLEASK